MGQIKNRDLYKLPYLKIFAPGAALWWLKPIKNTCQAACHGETEHGIFVKFEKQAKLLSSYLPVSPSRELRAPGPSSYHLVPKHLRTTLSRPEQYHLLP